MEENPGLSNQYRMASPWPVFVALGVVVAELGLVFGAFPVAVGGLLLFGGSVAGILAEAGYVATPWRSLAVLGVLLGVAGAALAFSELGLVTRGYAVIVAAAFLLLGSVTGSVVVESRPDGV
jgi:hypothetical protein